MVSNNTVDDQFDLSKLDIQALSGEILEGATEEEVAQAEKRLGFRFPSQLREFYLDIGYGHLTTPENPAPPAGD